jgi:hypothetical protein
MRVKEIEGTTIDVEIELAMRHRMHFVLRGWKNKANVVFPGASRKNPILLTNVLSTSNAQSHK